MDQEVAAWMIRLVIGGPPVSRTIDWAAATAEVTIHPTDARQEPSDPSRVVPIAVEMLDESRLLPPRIDRQQGDQRRCDNHRHRVSRNHRPHDREQDQSEIDRMTDQPVEPRVFNRAARVGRGNGLRGLRDRQRPTRPRGPRAPRPGSPSPRAELAFGFAGYGSECTDNATEDSLVDRQA